VLLHADSILKVLANSVKWRLP